MRILIVAATQKEIAGFVNENPGQEVLITGVGVPACMHKLSLHLEKKEFDFVLQAGICGSFHEDWQPDAVLVKQDRFADLAVLESGALLTLAEAKIERYDAPYSDDGWLINPHQLPTRYAYPVVSAVTVNTIGDNERMNLLYREKFSPDIESMEGAAFHYCCLAARMPFMQVRTVSNRVGERNKENWRLGDAVKNLGTALTDIYKSLKSLEIE